MVFNAQMIKVVNKRGYNHGALNSSNITSTIQIIAIFIINPKSPKVIILKGKVMASNMGFTKRVKSPKVIPKSKNMCQFCVRLIPKKLELGINNTFTPGTN